MLSIFKKYRDNRGRTAKAGDRVHICPRDVGWDLFIHYPPTPDIIDGTLFKDNGKLMLRLENSQINGSDVVPASVVLDDDFRFVWVVAGEGGE